MHEEAPLFDAAADPRSLRRFEDRRFLIGAGRYTDDTPADGELVAVVLRSPHAHARIVAIDTAAATALRGVHGVFTGADLLADGAGALPCRMTFPDDQPLFVPPRYPLAHGRVRHVGDGVALVVADTHAIARDALERIIVEYDPLPALTDPTRAQEAGAPLLWKGAPGNVAFQSEPAVSR